MYNFVPRARSSGDRALASEAKGRAFNSRRARQIFQDLTMLGPVSTSRPQWTTATSWRFTSGPFVSQGGLSFSDGGGLAGTLSRSSPPGRSESF
jgi:hypothetical protein